MTRVEAEKELCDRFMQICELYMKYNPNGEYLTFCLNTAPDGLLCITFNNRYWDQDAEKTINHFEYYSG